MKTEKNFWGVSGICFYIHEWVIVFNRVEININVFISHIGFAFTWQGGLNTGILENIAS